MGTPVSGVGDLTHHVGTNIVSQGRGVIEIMRDKGTYDHQSV